MLDGDDNNEVTQNGCNDGIGAEPLKAVRNRKRILTSDLSARIAELEGRLEVISAAMSKPQAPSELEQKVAELASQIAKLDERVSKIAHVVAQSNLMHAAIS
jgi:hypothetical protein